MVVSATKCRSMAHAALRRVRSLFPHEFQALRCCLPIAEAITARQGASLVRGRYNVNNCLFVRPENVE